MEIHDKPQDPYVLKMMAKLQKRKASEMSQFDDPKVMEAVTEMLQKQRDSRIEYPGHVIVNRSEICTEPASKQVRLVFENLKSSSQQEPATLAGRVQAQG